MAGNTTLLDNADSRSQHGNRPDTIPYIIYEYYENIGEEESGIKIGTKDVSGNGAWGKGFNDSGNTVNNLNWGAGTAVWDGTYVNEISYDLVINPTGVFHEHYVDSEFIDSSETTGTVALGVTGTITLDIGERLQSNMIQNNNRNILSATFNLNKSLITNSNTVETYLSNDNKVTWEIVLAVGELHTFSSTGSQLFYRIVSPAGSGAKYGTGKYGTGTYAFGGIEMVIDTKYVTNNKIVDIKINQ